MYMLNLFCEEQFCWPKSDEVKIFTHVGMSWVSGVLEKIFLLHPFCMLGQKYAFELENCNIIELYWEPVVIVENNDSENYTASHHPHDEVEVGPNLEYE